MYHVLWNIDITYVSLSFYMTMQSDYRGFVKAVFVESIDMLISSARDGKMCKQL